MKLMWKFNIFIISAVRRITLRCRVFVSLLLIFLFLPKPAYGFFSPSTLQLLSTILPSSAIQVLGIVLAWIVTFFLKIKKAHKKAMLLVIGGTFLGVVTATFVNFYGLYKRNKSKAIASFQLEEQEDMRGRFFQTEEDYQNEVPVVWDNEEIKKHSIDLNKETLSSLNTFFKIDLLCHKYCSLPDSVCIDNQELFKLLKEKKASIKEFLISKGLGDNQKILFSCYNGFISLRMAYLFSLLGYDAYFTYFSNLKKDDLLTCSFDFFKEDIAEKVIIVQNCNSIEKNNLVHFLFDVDDMVFVPNRLFDTNLKIILTYNKEVSSDDKEAMEQIKPYIFSDPFKNIYNDFIKIVCTTDFNCLLTKHYLYSKGYDDGRFRYIYQCK